MKLISNLEKKENSKEEKGRVRVKFERLFMYLFMILAFFTMIIFLGTILPEYFGEASRLLLDNYFAFLILMTFAIIIYILTQKK